MNQNTELFVTSNCTRSSATDFFRNCGLWLECAYFTKILRRAKGVIFVGHHGGGLISQDRFAMQLSVLGFHVVCDVCLYICILCLFLLVCVRLSMFKLNKGFRGNVLSFDIIFVLFSNLMRS